MSALCPLSGVKQTTLESKPERGSGGAPLQSVPGAGPTRAGCRAIRDSTLVAWYRCLYAPRTGGAYDGHHRTAGIAGRTRRRGGRVAARGARAAARENAPYRRAHALGPRTIRRGKAASPHFCRVCRRRAGQSAATSTSTCDGRRVSRSLSQIRDGNRSARTRCHPDISPTEH